MKCAKCGAPIPDDAKRCPLCGEPTGSRHSRRHARKDRHETGEAYHRGNEEDRTVTMPYEDPDRDSPESPDTVYTPKEPDTPAGDTPEAPEAPDSPEDTGKVSSDDLLSFVKSYGTGFTEEGESSSSEKVARKLPVAKMVWSIIDMILFTFPAGLAALILAIYSVRIDDPAKKKKWNRLVVLLNVIGFLYPVLKWGITEIVDLVGYWMEEMAFCAGFLF